MGKAQLKEKVESLLNDLPEDADWNDLMYKIYVRQSIEQGLKDVEEGTVVPHEEIKRKFNIER
jgi:predicted transcriptional regulator